MKETAQLLLDEWKELDSFCETCEGGDETQYNWCDMRVMTQNCISKVLKKLGFTIDENDTLVEL